MFFDEHRRLLGADLAYTLYNAERALSERALPCERRDFAGAVAVRDPEGQDWYYNRVFGLTDITPLDDILAWYGASPFAVTLFAGQLDGLGRALSARGLVPQHEAVFLGCPLTQPEEGGLEIEVRRAEEGDLGLVYELWGAEVSSALATRRAQAHLDPRFAIYLASVEGEPVAMATSFYAEGLVWLGNANTRPASRGLGCHRALIARRLEDARHRGCDWALLDTAFGSASHRNASRHGMEVVTWSVQMCRH